MILDGNEENAAQSADGTSHDCASGQVLAMRVVAIAPGLRRALASNWTLDDISSCAASMLTNRSRAVLGTLVPLATADFDS